MSLIAGLEYGMERWNGTVNVTLAANLCNYAQFILNNLVYIPCVMVVNLCHFELKQYKDTTSGGELADSKAEKCFRPSLLVM